MVHQIFTWHRRGVWEVNLNLWLYKRTASTRAVTSTFDTCIEAKVYLWKKHQHGDLHRVGCTLSTLLGRNEFFRQTSVVWFAPYWIIIIIIIYALTPANHYYIILPPRRRRTCNTAVVILRAYIILYIHTYNIYIHLYICIFTCHIYTYTCHPRRPCGGEIRGVRALTAPKSIGRENFANSSFTPARALRVRVCACARCKNGDEVKTLAKRCFNYILYYYTCVCARVRVCACVCEPGAGERAIAVHIARTTAAATARFLFWI